MPCEKTGAHIHLPQYGLFAVCDAFQLSPDRVYCFRVAGTSSLPMRDILHYTVYDVMQWFDRDSSNYSTVLSSSSTYYGYEGRLTDEEGRPKKQS